MTTDPQFLALPVLILCAVILAILWHRHGSRTWDFDDPMARPFLDG